MIRYLQPKYSTPHAGITSPPPPRARRAGGAALRVDGVRLLGVAVTAHAALSAAEHERRGAAGLGAVTDPALLDRLLDLPLATPVADPVTWAETADQPPGVVERGQDRETVVRLMEPPLAIDDVVVAAGPGRASGAVADASLFAGFTRRWIAAAPGPVPDSVVLAAKLCGVGILDARGQVLVAAEPPATVTLDGWAWLLQERTYRRWLSQQTRAHALASPPPATGEASAAPAGRHRTR
jgi:hypothetical protein